MARLPGGYLYDDIMSNLRGLYHTEIIISFFVKLKKIKLTVDFFL